jgi:hypothetical protein
MPAYQIPLASDRVTDEDRTMGPNTTGSRRPYLGTFYGPHREEYVRVAEHMAMVVPSLAAHLRGGLGMTGPFDRLHVLDDDARWAFARALGVLEERLHEIAPEAFAPDPALHGMLVISGEPWIYLEWALGAKVAAIAGHGVLGETEVERLERPWRTIFR